MLFAPLFSGLGTGILITAAVVPAVVLLILVYRTDRLEPEPPGLLLSLVGLGAAAILPALLAELLGGAILGWVLPNAETDPGQYFLYQLLENFLVVALAEEGFKYLALKLRTWRSPHFNCQYDAVVYAVFVSLGFALLENIFYVINGGISTALLRAVLSVPGHACFGVFMGVFYGVAKRASIYGDELRSRRWRFLGILVPVLLHGTYDFLASADNILATLVFLAFVIGMFVISFLQIKKSAARDTFYHGTGTL